MGGWTDSLRRLGLADEDNPSADKVERRRQADIDFITRVRASRDRTELGVLLMAYVKVRWKTVCIERRLKQLDEEGAP